MKEGITSMFVNSDDVIEYFKDEFRRRRFERYEIISFDDCLELLEEAIDRADRIEKEGEE